MSDNVLPNASIIGKITKLLALADKKSGATEAEALSAANMAQELLQKYGLEMAEIEASGGKAADDGKREKTTVKRSSMYKWQRELMETLAETNFCMHRIHEERDEKTGRKAKRHQLIGRTVNVVATQLMYDYLVSTMKRLVSEAGHSPGNHSEQDYHFWLEGCGVRLQDRIREKAEKAQKENARKERERQAAASHPSAAGGVGKNMLVLADLYTNEAELNEDMLQGLEPGTTTRERLEREEKVRRRDAKFAALKAQGVDEDVAYYMSHGYSRERAEAIVAQHRKEAAEEALKIANAKPRKSRASSGGSRYSSWTKADQREEDKRNSSAFRAGSQAGEDIGLDHQVKHEEKKRIG